MSEAGGKTSMGMAPNIAGLLCYVLGWISGIVFLVVEKDNRFVRFHAIQSIVVFGVLGFASVILGYIPYIGVVIDWFIGILGLILWIILMIKAYQGQEYKLPWAGDFSKRHV